MSTTPSGPAPVPPGLPAPFGTGSPLPFPTGPFTAESGWAKIQKAAATQLPTALTRAKRNRRATLRLLRGRARG